jgi:hypothetical protein
MGQIKRFLLFAFAALAAFPAMGQTIFNCPSFANTGSCGVAIVFPQNETFGILGATNGSTPVISGSAANIAPLGAEHTAISLDYYLAGVTNPQVNVQAFTTTFTFKPNGENFAFVINNVTNTGFDGQNFSAGASGEGGFSQFANGPNIAPINVWAFQIDSGGGNHFGNAYTVGGLQWYQSLPNGGRSMQCTAFGSTLLWSCNR